jgi:hypothetical protein
MKRTSSKIVEKIWRKIVMLTILLFVVFMVSACATVNQGSAGKLADQGALVAKTVGQSYQSTGDDLDRYVEAEYLLSGIKPGYSPPTDEMLKNIDTIEKELQLRQQMFAGLNDVYVSFGALCTYDAKGEVEKSMGNTMQAANNLATELGGTVPASVDKLFTAVTGDVVGQFQSERIKNASVKIRSLLEGIVFLLEKQNEKDAVNGMQDVISRDKLKVAKYFWENGYALADGILDEEIQSYGLTPKTIALSDASKNKYLSNGIDAVLDWREKKEVNSQVAAYNATIQSLRTLISEHSKIEAGEPVNLEAIQGYMSTVQQYVNLITAVKKGK